MWIKVENKDFKYATDLVNTETQEHLQVATQDADRILHLIQPRFVKRTTNNKIYIIDTTDELIGIPVKETYRFTTDDDRELQKWLDYLNRDDNND